ncbi:MAG: glycosyltransferase family 2 protein [Anaerolineae bacterium]|jgi:hypothetical protein|nr:glycosyltransferase family 2 protein [Anaerolineae bacterium]
MRDLAVIIVTWNAVEFIRDALDTLYADLAGSGLNAEVYVVDSASSDGTAEVVAVEYPQVKLTASRENLGFGRSNNLGLREAGFFGDDSAAAPRAAYLLNPDTLTQPGATRTLFDALFSAPDIGLVGARLSYEDGSFQHGAFGFPGLRQLWAEFFPTPGRLLEGAFNGRYPRHLYDAGQPFPIDFPLGATMMLRREAVQQTGGFDPKYFMYCEEVDWAWRIKQAGWRVLCAPSAHVVHLSGKSTSQVKPRSVVNLWTSRLTLYDTLYPGWKAFLARRMIAYGMARKAAAEADPAVREAYQTVRALSLQPTPAP